MKKTIFLLLFSVCFSSVIYAQLLGTVKGKVIDAETQAPLVNVNVTVTGTDITQQTDADGNFVMTNVPVGNQLIKVSLKGYESQNFPAEVSEGQEVDLGTILLFVDLSLTDNSGLISLSEDELNDDTGGADNISGLLSSSRDLFSRTAAFEFSSSFFRVRGLDSDNGKVLINGIEMNKVYNGRPQWSNWGGLNDVLRNQELSIGLSPSSYTFGGALGSTNINTRASQARAGGRVTYSSSNRSYTNRVMASYASGMTKSGWAYTFSIGRRWGNEGYIDATSYNANSVFASIEKKINEHHSLNFTGIYAFNRRGKSSPNTQEVFDLKGRKYNEYWGWQNGHIRNSRIKEIEEPILMLNHYWKINDKVKLNTNVGYQFGKLGNSRLDYNGTDLVNGFPEGGGANPSPAYYQKLPSFFLRNNPDDPGIAFGAQQEFVNNGQINWNALY
ncbi:MAG TPA: TonB-dependent receptor, partial [Flavobacteriia bacterium]|nr:TonB-dependent receptor [Flavobacteriia bacterium]